MYGNGNTEQNREFLKDKPHREFQDLSVIYRWIVGTREDGVASVVINDGMVKDLGMTAEELFQAAVQNTKAMFPPKVTDMAEMMMSLMMPLGVYPSCLAAPDMLPLSTAATNASHRLMSTPAPSLSTLSQTVISIINFSIAR